MGVHRRADRPGHLNDVRTDHRAPGVARPVQGRRCRGGCAVRRAGDRRGGALLPLARQPAGVRRPRADEPARARAVCAVDVRVRHALVFLCHAGLDVGAGRRQPAGPSFDQPHPALGHLHRTLHVPARSVRARAAAGEGAAGPPARHDRLVGRRTLLVCLRWRAAVRRASGRGVWRRLPGAAKHRDGNAVLDPVAAVLPARHGGRAFSMVSGRGGVLFRCAVLEGTRRDAAGRRDGAGGAGRWRARRSRRGRVQRPADGPAHLRTVARRAAAPAAFAVAADPALCSDRPVRDRAHAWHLRSAVRAVRGRDAGRGRQRASATVARERVSAVGTHPALAVLRLPRHLAAAQSRLDVDRPAARIRAHAHRGAPVAGRAAGHRLCRACNLDAARRAHAAPARVRAARPVAAVQHRAVHGEAAGADGAVPQLPVDVRAAGGTAAARPPAADARRARRPAGRRRRALLSGIEPSRQLRDAAAPVGRCGEEAGRTLAARRRTSVHRARPRAVARRTCARGPGRLPAGDRHRTGRVQREPQCRRRADAVGPAERGARLLPPSLRAQAEERRAGGQRVGRPAGARRRPRRSRSGATGDHARSEKRDRLDQPRAGAATHGPGGAGARGDRAQPGTASGRRRHTGRPGDAVDGREAAGPGDGRPAACGRSQPAIVLRVLQPRHAACADGRPRRRAARLQPCDRARSRLARGSGQPRDGAVPQGQQRRSTGRPEPAGRAGPGQSAGARHPCPGPGAQRPAGRIPGRRRSGAETERAQR